MLRVRNGVLVGLALLPLAFTVAYGYRPGGIWVVQPYLAALAPVGGWLAVRLSGRIGRRSVVGRLLLLVGLAGAGVWAWWLHGLLTFGGAPLLQQVVVLVVAVVGLVSAGLVGGRRRQISGGQS